MDNIVYIIIGILMLMTIYFIYFFVSKSIEKDAKSIQKIKEVLEKHGTLTEDGLYSKFHFNNESYYVYILKIKPQVKLKFNSSLIWEKRIGHQISYLNMSVFAKLPGKKMVIIYPHEGPYMYHYDENEIKFTQPNQRIWDMHIIAKHQLDEVLKEGIK